MSSITRGSPANAGAQSCGRSAVWHWAPAFAGEQKLTKEVAA